ncbi:transposase [Citrobacter amalonaticus]|nr:transposase [Citrobacter amalonaticus]
MSGLNIIGIDLAKTDFYLFSLSPEGKSAGRIKLSRDKLIGWFTTQPRMVVAMEACGASHHWAREIQKTGHNVVMLTWLCHYFEASLSIYHLRVKV